MKSRIIDAVSIMELVNFGVFMSNAILLSDNSTTENPVTEGYRTAALSKGKVDGRVSDQWANRPDDE